MKNTLNKVPEIFLHPGEFHLSTEPEVVTTILGSCVSIIMFDKAKRISMMSHNLMPVCENLSSCKGDCENVHRYTECSVKQMLQIFDSVKIPRNDIVVKLFGGSELINDGHHADNITSIGSRNITSAKNIIEKEALKLTAQDIGGRCSRKIVFITETGEVYLRRTSVKNKLSRKK
jgi:chemotaxis protein CheD